MRLLGVFVSIHFQVDATEVVVRELLNPNLKHPLSLIGKQVRIGLPRDEVKLFK